MADIRKITPAHILAWPGPGGHIDQRTDRIAAENQWYAVTGRIEKIKVEDDGDIHVEMKDIGADASIVVELPLGPRWCDMRKMVFSWTNATFPLTGKFKLTQHPIITVVGKAFYDIDHSGKDTHTNRRNYDQSIGVWEIHPVMKIALGATDSPSVVATSPAPKFSAQSDSTAVIANAGAGYSCNTAQRVRAICYPHSSSPRSNSIWLDDLACRNPIAGVIARSANCRRPLSGLSLHDPDLVHGSALRPPLNRISFPPRRSRRKAEAIVSVSSCSSCLSWCNFWGAIFR